MWTGGNHAWDLRNRSGWGLTLLRLAMGAIFVVAAYDLMLPTGALDDRWLSRENVSG